MDIEKLLESMSALVDSALAEGRPLTEEEIQTYEALEVELKAAQKTNELFARQEAWQAPVIEAPNIIKATPKGDDAEMYAFEQYLRTGQLNSDLTYAQTVGTTTEGGYAVPDAMRIKLTEGRSAYGGFMNLCEQITTENGAPLPWPTIIAAVSTEADIAAEGAASAAGADLVFGEASLGAYKYASTGASNIPLKVSVELLQDAQFPVADFVAKRLGERIQRKLSYDLIRGSGSSEPLGIMEGASGDISTASGSVPTYAKLVSLVHSLDPAYRREATFIFNDTTLGVLESIVDSGRPILAPGDQGIREAPGNGRLLGYPVVVDQAIADGANNVQFIGFGHYKAAYVVRHVKDVQILVNPFTQTGYVVFDAWARADGTVQDAAAHVTMEGTT